MEEKLSGDQGEGERDDQGCEEEGLQETGDHRRPEKIEEKEDLGHQMTKMDLCSSVLLDLELGPDKSRDLRPLRSSARAALCSLQATNTILTCFSMEKTLEMKLRSPAPPTSPCPQCTCCAASRQSRGRKDAGCT